jgi:hypothetical protein
MAGKVAIAQTDDMRGVKTMLRVYNGEQKGATAFFRNRPLLQTLSDLLQDCPSKKIRVLFHAVSVGAEVYSFAVWSMMQGLHKRFDLEFVATDINQGFLDFARAARYPSAILQTMTPDEKAYFEDAGNGEVSPLETVRNMVRFLPAMSFLDPPGDGMFDIVFVLNALTYVTEDQQAEVIAQIAGYNSRYLVISAFHPDAVEGHLRQNGYSPIPDNIEAIHNGWHERIRSDITAARGTDAYSWALQPFSRTEGYQYRLCAIFERVNAA